MPSLRSSVPLLHFAVGFVPHSSLLHSVAVLRICSTTRPGVVYLLTAGQAEADIVVTISRRTPDPASGTAIMRSVVPAAAAAVGGSGYPPPCTSGDVVGVPVHVMRHRNRARQHT